MYPTPISLRSSPTLLGGSNNGKNLEFIVGASCLLILILAILGKIRRFRKPNNIEVRNGGSRINEESQGGRKVDEIELDLAELGRIKTDFTSENPHYRNNELIEKCSTNERQRRRVLYIKAKNTYTKKTDKSNNRQPVDPLNSGNSIAVLGSLEKKHKNHQKQKRGISLY